MHSRHRMAVGIYRTAPGDARSVGVCSPVGGPWNGVGDCKRWNAEQGGAQELWKIRLPVNLSGLIGVETALRDALKLFK